LNVYYICAPNFGGRMFVTPLLAISGCVPEPAYVYVLLLHLPARLLMPFRWKTEQVLPPPKKAV